MMSIRRFLFLVGILAGMLAAAVPPLQAQQDVRLRPGDHISIRLGSVPGSEIEQVSGEYTIDEGGFVNMPYIGKIRAAGMTQEGLQSSIEGGYRSQQIYTNPSIIVTVSSGAPRYVNLEGQVQHAQRLEYTADLTLLSAITGAGGFTDYADQKHVRLMRGGKVMTVNVKDILKDPSKDIHLEPGDIIDVQQSFW